MNEGNESRSDKTKATRGLWHYESRDTQNPNLCTELCTPLRCAVVKVKVELCCLKNDKVGDKVKQMSDASNQ
jgi:hypothetical protein